MPFPAAQQVVGREGEIATLLSRCFISLSLCGGGFAPRHLNRYIASPVVQTKNYGSTFNRADSSGINRIDNFSLQTSQRIFEVTRTDY
jgi:hypothetical protein